MEIIGYLASVLIGISLGLIGGGGSILTVPVLVYLFSIDSVLATTYSLFVVGSTSLVGSISYLRNKLVDFHTAIFFGFPSMVAVFLTRRFLLPAIPEVISITSHFSLSKPLLLMVLFALLMILASYSMIKNEVEYARQHQTEKVFQVMLQGVLVGLLTGLIGAGGGFLIIPALVKLLKLPIKTAIGTSLLIISTNSLAGFAFSLGQHDLNWIFLLTVSAIAVLGIFVGSYWSTKIDGKKLKPTFGWFVLVMGLYIIIKETLLK